jgi:hypothetical protein
MPHLAYQRQHTSVLDEFETSAPGNSYTLPLQELLTSKVWYDEIRSSRTLLRLPQSMLISPPIIDFEDQEYVGYATVVEDHDDEYEW